MNAAPVNAEHVRQPARPPRTSPLLGLVAFAAVAAAQALGFVTSRPDRDMGHLQKIMYVHVPAAWSAFLCFFVVLVASLHYLWRRRERSDLLAASAAEVGTVFTALALVLGSIWGRPTWGVWWAWDARVTSTAVLLVIFVGYLALRAFTDDPDRRARWSAAVGILGALNVPVVYMSVQWWRTLHQTQSSPSTVDPAYALGLRANGIAFVFVLIYLLRRRYETAILERDAERRRDEAALSDEAGVRPEVARV
ncbi:MAG: cytochrome c biogenesis protein CcsA [Gemmatimonadaceae bacterium]